MVQMLCCSVPPTGPIDHFHSGSTLGGNPPPTLPPPPPPPTQPQKMLEVRTRRNKNFGCKGGLCCAVCAPLQRGGGCLYRVAGCVRALRKHRLPATDAAAPKKIVLCAVSGQPPALTPKRCACTPPTPPGHHYNPSQEGTCHQEIRIQQLLVSRLLNSVRLPLAPLTLHYVQIISNTSRSHPPPAAADLAPKQKCRPS